jgi:hypothetical protein
MTDIVPESSKKPDSRNDSGPWYEGTHGERIAVRLSSLDTKGVYAIIQSIAAPGCATPMHLHRNEAEHFAVIAGSYRIAIGEKIFEVRPGLASPCLRVFPIAGAISPASPGAWWSFSLQEDLSNVSRPSPTVLPRSLKRSRHPTVVT